MFKKEIIVDYIDCTTLDIVEIRYIFLSLCFYTITKFRRIR